MTRHTAKDPLSGCVGSWKNTPQEGLSGTVRHRKNVFLEAPAAPGPFLSMCGPAIDGEGAQDGGMGG